MMASLDYNYQNLSRFLFLMLIRAIVISTPLGIQNLNNKEKKKWILVVVVKWQQRANLLFDHFLFAFDNVARRHCQEK